MFSKTLVFAFIGAFVIVGALGDVGDFTNAVITNCQTKATKEERNACYHEAARIEEDVVGCVDIDKYLRGTRPLKFQDKAMVDGVKKCVKAAAKGEKIGTCNRWTECKTNLINLHFDLEFKINRPVAV